MVHWHISRISYRFAVIRHFIFGWQLPIPTNFRGVFRVKHPQLSELHISHPQKSLPYTRPRLLSYCAPKIDSRVWAVALLKNKKTKKVTVPVYVDPTWRLDRSSDRTKFGRAGNLPNVITHAKFHIDWNKIVPLAKGWSFMCQHYCGGRH